MKISPMTPRFLQETILNICCIVGILVGAAGIYCFFFTELSKGESLLVTALGAGIFFGFRKVKSLKADYEENEAEDDSKGAP